MALCDEPRAGLDIWQTPEVVSLFARIYGCSATHLNLEDATDRIPAYVIRRPWRSDRLILSPFYFIPRHPQNADAVAIALLEKAKTLGIRASDITFRLIDPVTPTLAIGLGLQNSMDCLQTIIPLQAHMEDQRRAYRRRLREKLAHDRSIIAAQGIEIRLFSGMDDLDDFHRLLVRVYRDKHAMICQPRGLFRGLFAMNFREPGMSCLGYGAFLNGKMVAGMLVLTDQQTWRYCWGATDEAAPRSGLSAQMLDQAIADSIASGAKFFDLGSTPQSHAGLRQFKRGWGGQDHPVLSYGIGRVPPVLDLHTAYPLARHVLQTIPVSALTPLSSLAVRVLV
jgi:hypothetical protein